MPMTVTTGLSKKVGTPNYGSVGAMCNITFEADHNLLEHDLEGFQQRVKNAFVAARQAVQDQLARELNAPAGNNGTTNTESVAATNGNGNGATNAATNGANGNHGNGTAANANGGNGLRNGSNGASGHNASEKQLGYAKQLAKSIQGLGIRRLETLAEKMFGKPLVSLTTLDASGLIDSLKAIKEGRIDLNSVLEGNAA